MPSSSYTVQTPAFEEVTGQPVQAGAQALDREDGGTPKKYDLRLTCSPPNTARSGRSSYRYRTGKSLNFLGKATPANSTTIYNNERIPRPHREVKRAEKPKTINELMETPEGRYLFKKIGDKMMQSADPFFPPTFRTKPTAKAEGLRRFSKLARDAFRRDLSDAALVRRRHAPTKKDPCSC